MMVFKFLCVVGIALLPLGCGGATPSGSGESEAEAEAEGSHESEAEAEGNQLTGFIVATAEPALAGGVPFQLFVDGTMMVSVATGGAEARAEVTAGRENRHKVKIVCPGYGYAVDGYTFYSDSQPVSDWEMRDVTIDAGATKTVNATVCRDLTGRWMFENTPGAPSDVTMVSENELCGTSNMPAINFTIQGDTVRPGGGSGDWIPILNNGRRIEVKGYRALVRID